MDFLELHAVRKSYGPQVALAGVDLQVTAGSRTAIVGPSGSGKTTLLRIIAGFEAPDVGRVTLGSQTLADGPNAVPAHRRGIGFVPQEGALFPHLSVADNVGFGLDFACRTQACRAQRHERVQQVLQQVGLSEHASKKPHTGPSG